MTDPEGAIDYLKRIFGEWEKQDGTLKRHVRARKRSGLAADFKKDSAEVRATVCPYIKEAGYAQSKSILLKAGEGLAGLILNFQLESAADIVLGALLDVCGYKKEGDKLIEKGT